MASLRDLVMAKRLASNLGADPKTNPKSI